MPLTNAEKSKRYRERHPDRFRDSLKKYWNKKYTCECGKTLTQKNRAVHRRTAEHKRHIEYMNMKYKIDVLEGNIEEKKEDETIIKCVCGAKVEEEHIDSHKANSKKHLDYEESKQYRLQQVICECGVSVSYKHLARHRGTVKHIEGMNNKAEQTVDINDELKEAFGGETETDSEEDNFINNYLSKGKYDNNGLLITTDSDTD